MEITEEIKQKFIKKISEIFRELPEHVEKIHCDISITIEGEIILSFEDPIKWELIRLFKKQYIIP